jgi:hypothetical protein
MIRKLLIFCIILAFACPSYRTHQLIWVSDTSTKVLGPDTNGVYINSVPTSSSAWPNTLSGATAIWDAAVVSQPTVTQICYFSKTIQIPGNVSSAILQIASDNSMSSVFNGVTTSCKNADYTWSTPNVCNITSYLTYGENLLQFTVTNFAGSAQGNPAGLKYILTVKYNVNN